MKKIELFVVLIMLMAMSTSLVAQNNALHFDGTDDYVNCGIVDLSFQSFAIEGWFKVDELPPASGNYMYDDIFGIETGVDAALLRINGANQKLEFVMGWNSVTQVVTSNTTMISGQWYHVAILFHHSARNMYIIINGKVDVGHTISGGDNNYSNNTFRIGGEGNYRSFDGQIDEVKVWRNIDRGENDIRNEMYEEIIGNETGLVAYYNLNETSGTTANDGQTSSTYDGTLTNMAGSEWTTSSAFFGPKNCGYFNGVNSYVSLGNAAYNDNFSNGIAITMEYWFKGSVLQSPVRFQDISGNYVIAGWGTGDPEFIISTDGGGGGGLTIGTSSMVEDGNWHHVACTWEKNSTNGFKTYVDGILTNQRNSANVNLPAINYNGLLGAYHGPAEVLNGNLDEVRIWTDVRTEAEIRENMNKTLTGNEANLVMYYNFDGYTLPNVVGLIYDGGLANLASQPSTAFNTWLDTDNSTWTTAANWSSGTVPASTDNVGIYDYSGFSPILSGTPTVNDLVVGSTSDLSLGSNVTVNGNLFLYDDLDLNGQIITLGSSATLFEDSGNISGTSGTIQTTRDLSNINENVAGLGAEIDEDGDLGETTIIRGHEAQGSNGIERYYQISTTNSPTNATLVFNYLDSELNGVTEADLKLFKSPAGNDWTVQSASTIDTGDNTLTLTGMNSFSWWTAGDGDSPLPVNLSSFYALYIGGTPSVYWTTQSETDNAYWNVYRGTSDNFEAAALLNANNPVAGNGTTNSASDYVYVDSVPVIPNTTYWYWIEDVSTNGETEVHEPITLSIPSEDTPITPENYGLKQNYPNPFNPSTSISFALAEDSDVELIIYNVKGKKIKSIFNDHIYADQMNTVIWDGNDSTGKQVSSGAYFYKLITDSKEYQKKMLLVK